MDSTTTKPMGSPKLFWMCNCKSALDILPKSTLGFLKCSEKSAKKPFALSKQKLKKSGSFRYMIFFYCENYVEIVILIFDSIWNSEI
jgi:hypothetical protein